MSESLIRAHITREQLAQPYARISIIQAQEIISSAYSVTDDPALGIKFDFCTSMMEFSPLHITLSGCGSFEKMLTLYNKYTLLIDGAGDLTVRNEGDALVVELDLLNNYADLRRFCLELRIFNILNYARFFSNENLVQDPKITLDSSLSEQGYKTYKKVCDNTIDVSTDKIELRFPLELFKKRRSLNYDVHFSNFAKRQCNSLSTHIEQYHKLLASISESIFQKKDGPLTIEHIAQKLANNPRSLARDLHNIGTSFKESVDSVRRSMAISYLKETDASIDEIAWRLNYSDTSNFRRSFKKWTSEAPSIFRQNFKRQQINNRPTPSTRLSSRDHYQRRRPKDRRRRPEAP
jgi:AraC-like DNA-binding protein